jgi:hypothetical protein
VSGLEIYKQRFADSGRQVFGRALNGARVRGRNYVVVEHFIEALNAEEGRLFGASQSSHSVNRSSYGDIRSFNNSSAIRSQPIRIPDNQ